MYAVFQDGSHQYKVSEGDQVEVDFCEVEAGKQIEFDQVLLFSGTNGVQVGRPTLKDVKVVAQVVEQTKGEKIYIQKHKRRKNYRRRFGHRQKMTQVRVLQIVASNATE